MRRKSLTDFGWRIDYCEIFCCQITDHIGVNSTSYSRKRVTQYCYFTYPWDWLGCGAASNQRIEVGWMPSGLAVHGKERCGNIAGVQLELQLTQVGRNSLAEF